MSALTVYTTRYSVLHTHPVCKGCAMCTALTHRGFTLRCWCTCCMRGVYDVWAMRAIKALLCGKFANCSNFLAQQCATASNYRSCSDVQTHGQTATTPVSFPYRYKRVQKRLNFYTLSDKIKKIELLLLYSYR